jgi:protein gp37
MNAALHIIEETGKFFTRGFQMGYVRDALGHLGIKWPLASCGIDCGTSPACTACPGLLQAKWDRDNKGIVTKVAPVIDFLLAPLQWTVRRMVFVCPEGDLFHEGISDLHIAKALAVMESTPQQLYIVLTKREKRMHALLTSPRFWMTVYDAGRELLGDAYQNRGVQWGDNIIIGVSVETQDYMYRADVLPDLPKSMTKAIFGAPLIGGLELSEKLLNCIDWFVCAPEIGTAWGVSPRPCKEEWMVDIKKQCDSSKIPFYLNKRSSPGWIRRTGFTERPTAWPQVVYDLAH